MVVETLMVRHGAPTLAGMKTGSLFNVHMVNSAELVQEVVQINQTLEPKGARLIIIRRGNRSVLLYLYRETLLAQCLACPKAQELLQACGYTVFTPHAALDTLRFRLQTQAGFPHEIGLFLGYPLADVTGFIRNRGRNCLLCGCWKVYGEAEKAICTFARYRKCTDIYSKRFNAGYSLGKLTVAAKSA